MTIESCREYVNGLYNEYESKFRTKPEEKRPWYVIQMVNAVIKAHELELKQKNLDNYKVKSTFVIPDLIS